MKQQDEKARVDVLIAEMTDEERPLNEIFKKGYEIFEEGAKAERIRILEGLPEEAKGEGSAEEQQFSFGMTVGRNEYRKEAIKLINNPK